MDTHIDQSPKETAEKPEFPDMQQAPDFCCPCGGFLGWKQIRLGGKSLSRSYSDLRTLGTLHTRGWAWDTPPPLQTTKEIKEVKPQPGTSTLERLPPEVLGMFPCFFFLSILICPVTNFLL